MQILRDDEVPDTATTWSYRETAWQHLTFGAITSALALGAVAYPFYSGNWDSILLDLLCAVGAMIFGFMGLIGIRAFRASLRPGSWLLRTSPDALYLRFRSYHNWRFPADTPSVVKFDRREIAWLRPRAKRLQLMDEMGDWSSERRIKGLEISLRQVDTAPLIAALAAEGQRRDHRRVRTNHSPVVLGRDGLIEVELRRPHVLLSQLGTTYDIRSLLPDTTKDVADMTDAEKEDHMRDLLHAGHKVTAIAAARDLYGCDLTTARQKVEDLLAH